MSGVSDLRQSAMSGVSDLSQMVAGSSGDRQFVQSTDQADRSRRVEPVSQGCSYNSSQEESGMGQSRARTRAESLNSGQPQIGRLTS